MNKFEFVDKMNLNREMVEGCLVRFGVLKGEVFVQVSGFENKLKGSKQDVKLQLLEKVMKHFVVHSNHFHGVSAFHDQWTEQDSFAFEGFFEVEER